MKIIAIVNPGARSGKAGAEPMAEELRQLFAEAGIDAELQFPDSDLPGAARRASERARRGEFDAVVVGGGDGTVRCVASALAGTGLPLGVLPLGTRNHFARDLKLPLDLAGAVAVIAAGHVRPVDMGEVNGQLFINNSSVGVYPYMVIDRERQQRHGLAKAVAGVLAFIRMCRRFPRRRLRISAEGWNEPLRTPCLFVGNNEYSTGLFEVGRRQRLDGGELWICVVRKRNVLSFLQLAWTLALGRFDSDRSVTVRRARTAEIRSRASRLPVSLDGEVERLSPPLSYRIRPGVLRVLAPPAADAAPPVNMGFA